MLREIEGLSYEEIATIMECPISAVRSWIFPRTGNYFRSSGRLLDTAPNKRW